MQNDDLKSTNNSP